MAQKLQIEIEANLSGYTASLKEATQDNVELSDSAKKSAAEVSKAYTDVGKVQRAAFGGEETKKALANQTSEIVRLRENLELLYKEEIKLLSAGKGLTDAYKKNREDAAKARAEFDKLNASLRGNASSTEKVEQKAISTTTQLKRLREELRLLELAGKQNTKEFETLAVAAAKLQDQAGKTNDRIAALASSTFVFDAAIDSVNALAGGFAVAQGAIGLFAEDNEELQQAIAKTNSALAILNGLQQVQAFVTGQSAGKLGLLNAAQKVNAFVTNGATLATKAWRAALVATGIGALVVIIGTLISKLGESSDSFNEAAEAATAYQEAINKLNSESLPIQNRLIAAQINNLKALGKISETQAENLLRANKAQVLIAQNNIDAKEKETEALKRFEEAKIEDVKNAGKVLKATQEQLYIDLREIEAQRSAIEKAINLEIQNERLDSNKKIKKSTKESVKEQVKEYELLSLKVKDTIGELNRSLGVQTEEFLEAELAFRKIALLETQALAEQGLATEEDVLARQNSILLTELKIQVDAIKKNAKDKREAAKGNSAEIVEININENKQIELAEKTTNAEILRSNKELNDKKQANSKKTKEELIKDAKAVRNENLNNAAEIAQAFQQAFASIFALTNQLRENQITSLNEQEQRELDSAGNNARKRAQIEEKFAKERRKLEREQAVAQKNQAIFLAIINTAVAVIKALTSGGAIGPVLAAAAGIAGAAQIATIAATPLPKLERGGRIGGRRHVQGGTIIEAEKDEFIVSRNPAIKHGRELEAMNRSSREYMSLIDKTYVRPAVMDAIMTIKREDSKLNVNAKLDARNIESELRSMRRENKKGNKQLQSALFSKSNSRYTW